jgi:hypothetical protein
MTAALAKFGRLLLATLHEIFEESAYQRFLERNERPSSREAYAAFLHETQHVRERRARCC